jgi:putative acetyltransferase
MPEPDVVEVRPYRDGDDRAIAEVHRSAVHGLAARHYPADLLDEWSAPVTDERVARAEAARPTSPESLVVAIVDGNVAGFGGVELTTGEVTAVYVRPESARCSVGTLALEALEVLGRTNNVTEFWLKSSLNAVPFYAARGYVREREGEHETWSGRSMPCIFMRKRL